ncbi:hypothetical protein PARPLA_02480 [Rhodobacteraceae bacterium THAF1]|uniref:DUF1127 domain-containing protein n=1 Tax=Palleronia sp. THAF1 TaxID=2587842 RepID=UPI000F406B2E|nr:DUF1127 domain-containing protein [Palleronia sp. THAF1]QFU07960.1 hypothetical protein FIU81_04675 [Palleronia sp. THAF1]VDC27811.1 hypothetical protein PARPLA_02480 [Rhodobacteraceae bacterium THAF1]
MTTLAQSHIQSRRRDRVGLLRYWQLYRERAQLAGLDATALRDIGIDATAARTEATRPVWDAPDHWSR